MIPKITSQEISTILRVLGGLVSIRRELNPFENGR